LLANPSYTEKELVRLLKSRNERAFNFLYDNYSPAVYGVIIKVVTDTAAADDILQEVFIKIWKNVGQYDEAKGKLFTWIINIARNTAIDRLRSKSYQNDQNTSALDVTQFSNTGLAISRNVDHIGLNRLVKGLKAEYRAVIDLAYFKGYTQEEISKELDMPVGTVKTNVRRALIELKKFFVR
jgi:RNA polymerase sigma factor (sigma-70 family)